jgi:tetratricopeptide (TPR) repeat protein
MNLSPQTLLDALEGRLSEDSVSQLIRELSTLPSEVVLEVAEQAHISLTGDGNIYGNNNTINVSKGAGISELVQVLQEAYKQEHSRNRSTTPVRRSQSKSDDSNPSDISWEARDSNLIRWYFEQCAKYDDLFNNHAEWGDREIGEHLIAGGLADRDQEGHLYLTQAGVLLCCRRSQILRDIFHVHVKFTQKTNGTDFTEELFGSVLYLYKELYERLKSLFKRRIGTPDIRDETGGERLFFEYPETAIVEALVNCLIHRDYSLDDIGFITVYPDSVEFINPGQSTIPIERLLHATSPLRPRYPRNPRLIEAINKARLNQREGGGILRIRRELENNRSYLPDRSLGLALKNDEVNNRFILTIHKRGYYDGKTTNTDAAHNDTVTHGRAYNLGQISMIPRPPIVGYVARRDAVGQDIIERLKEELNPKKNHLVVLSGPGGVGKTTLAAEAARTFAQTYKGRVVWSSADRRADTSLSTLLDDIATQLDYPSVRQLQPEAKEAEVRAIVSHTPTLIVLDNFETIAPDSQKRIENWLTQIQGPALITSRMVIASTRNFSVPVMSHDEAQEFLERLIAQTQDPQVFPDKVRQRIFETAEANPFVMLWLVAQIDAAQEPDTVLKELAQGEGDAAERVFDRSFNLEQLGDDGRATLLTLSLFVPSATLGALAEVAGFGDDLKRVRGAVKNLRALWLIKGLDENRRFTVEGLTRTLTRARLSKDKRADEFRERFTAYFLAYAKEHTQPTSEDYDALETERGNLLVSIGMAFDISEWDTVLNIAAILTKPFGGVLSVRGYWDEAIRYGQQAMAAAQMSNNQLAVAQFAGNVAGLRINRGEYDEARKSYEQALTVFREQRSEANISIALHQLGRIAQEQGSLTEARRLYNESLEIAKKTDNTNSIANTLYELGTVAQDQGDIAEAQRLYGESLRIAKTLGNQRSIAIALHQLGKIAQEQGALAEAHRLYNESLEIAKMLGDQNSIAISLYSLGRIVKAEQNEVEAARFFREALQIFEKLKSPEAEIVRRNLESIESNS